MRLHPHNWRAISRHLPTGRLTPSVGRKYKPNVPTITELFSLAGRAAKVVGSLELLLAVATGVAVGLAASFRKA